MATPRKDKADYLKIGRPSDYKPEYCHTVFELMREGCSKAELCYHLRIARSTLDIWEKTYPEFKEAVCHGEDQSLGVWSQWGRENLTNKEFNTRLYEIQMMNRHNWSRKNDSKQELKVTTHESSLKELE